MHIFCIYVGTYLRREGSLLLYYTFPYSNDTGVMTLMLFHTEAVLESAYICIFTSGSVEVKLPNRAFISM